MFTLNLDNLGNLKYQQWRLSQKLLRAIVKWEGCIVKWKEHGFWCQADLAQVLAQLQTLN